MGWKAIAIAIIVPVFGIAGAILYSLKHWQSRTKALLAEMKARQLPIVPKS